MSGFSLRDGLRGLRDAIVEPIRDDFEQGTNAIKAAAPLPYAVAKATPVIGQAIGAAEVIGRQPEGVLNMLPAIGPAYRIGAQLPRTVAQATRTGGGRAQQMYQGLRQGVGAENTADIGEGAFEQARGWFR